jgi:ankyrin repeat protein
MIDLCNRRNADINSETNQGYTPLHQAAMPNHKDTVEMLILKGANLNAVTTGGMSPLMYARFYGNNDAVEILIKHGAQ